MNRRLRILHLITRLELGGAQLNTLATCRGLDPKRFEVFLANGPGGPLVPEGLAADRWRAVPHLERAIRPAGDRRALAELRELMRELRPDIVHTHSSKAGILGRWAAAQARVPLVVHSVHGFAFAPGQPWLVQAVYHWLERQVAPLTSHFIFVPRADLERAAELKLTHGNASLIRSGFALDRFRGGAGERTTVRRELALPDNAVVCGVIAPFKPQKGLHRLLDIAALVVARDPRVHFVIAGDGGLRRQIEAGLAERGIAGHFRLPGFVTRVERIMEGFDIGVSTAMWEGLPQSLVQLRLRGLPVVVSDIPAHREVVREEGNGFLVNTADPETFAERILRLAGNPELRRRLGGYAGDDFSEWDEGAWFGASRNCTSGFGGSGRQRTREAGHDSRQGQQEGESGKVQ
jgi:glycosyltransferase involved in cell wall biosynthesis